MPRRRQIIWFQQSYVDVACRDLYRDGVKQPVEPQVFDLILFLMQNRDRVVTRDELFETIWDGRLVSDATLSSRIKSARKALADNGKEQTVIRTYHGRGFRFVADTLVTYETLPELQLASEHASSENMLKRPVTSSAAVCLADRKEVARAEFR
ncbi:winged helix-turn-helix domain-containing protein [Pseudoruegeria sp. HB172150]|uniref:winged helix-turn-helix domain-containing protein n=1 Tax=Pseudoruegeria sp. HB172150 TaxID=2721164 RepID=UPI001552394B|nr:winged helix-turn-helix domain-containing protein [Pseudoruegeria sp. HB172150]